MIAICDEAIDVQAACRAVRTDGFGSLVVFQGVVRGTGARGQPVRELYYETYREIALAEMEAIADEVRARWMPCAVAIVHRIGTLHIAEVSVVVAIATPHRAPGFEACAYAIEQLKRRAAIWKQERYADGSTSWLDGAVPSGVRF